MAFRLLDSIQPWKIWPFAVGAGASWYGYPYLKQIDFSRSFSAKTLQASGGCSFQTLSANPATEKTAYDAYAEKPRPFATGNTLFSFGLGDSYALATRKDDTGALLWRAREHRASFAISQSSALGSLYWYAFTPHGDELVAYKNVDTKQSMYIFHKHIDRSNQAPSYHSLLRWLGKNVSQKESSLYQSFVVFGPGATYFARSATACTWHDLPQRLENIILEKKEDYDKDKELAVAGWIPRIVALGADDAWVAIWEDGRRASSLATTNGLVNDMEDGPPTEEWEHIALNLHDADDFFSCTKAGSLHFSFGNLDRSTHNALTARMIRYMQLRANEDGRTFEVRRNANGKTEELTISPHTDWREVVAA